MKLIKLLFFVIVMLLISNVIIANTAVDESIIVKQMNAEITNLTNQNLSLKQEIAKQGSLISVAERINALGFVEDPKIITLGTTDTIALR